jgi:hypothetical protein
MRQACAASLVLVLRVRVVARFRRGRLSLDIAEDRFGRLVEVAGVGGFHFFLVKRKSLGDRLV